MDSLYQGYPIGYIITWKNPNIRLKDGTISEGKKILIDGQQRVTALTAAILGEYVINNKYKKVRIKISFHPIEQRFEVFNTAIEKDNKWIPDISQIFSQDINIIKFINQYCRNNPDVDPELIYERIESLRKIMHKQIGLIELSSDLDIQADFAMSKIAANESYGGSTLRKCIDYFCHLTVSPEFYYHITDYDKDFAETEYFKKMSWLKNEHDDIYDPDYTDLLRVAFTYKFSRGKLADLVSLLSGRNFETRTYEEDIARESFEKL